MGTVASQITNLTSVYSTVYSDTDQRKHQSSASLAFVWGIHRVPVNSPHKWPVTRKMFPFYDVIMCISVSDVLILRMQCNVSFFIVIILHNRSRFIEICIHYKQVYCALVDIFIYTEHMEKCVIRTYIWYSCVIFRNTIWVSYIG